MDYVYRPGFGLLDAATRAPVDGFAGCTLSAARRHVARTGGRLLEDPDAQLRAALLAAARRALPLFEAVYPNDGCRLRMALDGIERQTTPGWAWDCEETAKAVYDAADAAATMEWDEARARGYTRWEDAVGPRIVAARAARAIWRTVRYHAAYIGAGAAAAAPADAIDASHDAIAACGFAAAVAAKQQIAAAEAVLRGMLRTWEKRQPTIRACAHKAAQDAVLVALHAQQDDIGGALPAPWPGIDRV